MLSARRHCAASDGKARERAAEAPGRTFSPPNEQGARRLDRPPCERSDRLLLCTVSVCRRPHDNCHRGDYGPVCRLTPTACSTRSAPHTKSRHDGDIVATEPATELQV